MQISQHPRRSEGEQLLREGRSVAEVCAAIGAGQTTVQRWARQLGLGRGRGQRGEAREPGPIAQEAIRRLLEGIEVGEVANDLGVTQSRIRQIRAAFLVEEENNTA